jgi:hypothetical protein
MRRYLPLLATSLLLTACVQKVDTRVNSAGAASPTPASYILVAPEKVTSPSYKAAQWLVADRLSKRGYTVSETGTLYLQVGIASRPASLELKQPDTILGEASKKPPSKRCPLNEYRLTVSLTKVTDGTEIYRASASEYHCKLSLEAVLPVLADAALADLGQPKGAYVIERKLPKQ